MKTELDLLDVCLPDYFTGYHRPVIAVPVFNNMTYGEMISGIESELNSVYDYLTNEDNGYSHTELLVIDEYLNTLRDVNPMDLYIGEEFEDSEGDDSIYAYFSITRKRYHKGIMCLS